MHPELRKRARFFRCHPDLRVASRLIGEAAPPSPRRPPSPGRSAAGPRRGVPSPPSPSGRPRTGSFDYAIVSKPPPPAPILLGSPSFVARRARARRARRRRATRRRRRRPPPGRRRRRPRNWSSPQSTSATSSAAAPTRCPYLYDDRTCGPSTPQNLKRWKPPFALHVRARRTAHVFGAG